MADEPDATPEREPGAPVPKDEIDPELVSLKPHRQIGLVTAFAVVAFCVYLAVRLWGDFRFAGQDAIVDVGVAEVAAGRPGVDAWVRVAADIERGAAVRVRQSRGVPGLRVVPAIGGSDRVWIVLDGDGWTRPREERRYSGRLRRLSDMPFAGSFRDHVRAHPSPRYVTAAELRRGRAAGDAGELTAVTGDRFTVAADDIVELVVFDPDAVTIAASFGERLPDIATWQAALGVAGVITPGTAPLRSDDSQVWFEARFPGALTAAATKLEAAGLWGARVEPVTRRHRATWGDVVVGDGGVTIAGATLPWSMVEVAAVHAARPLPEDPWVVIVGEEPERYWYVRPLYILLALFALLFTWALVRTARRELFSPRVPARA